MLQIVVPELEIYDRAKEEFRTLNSKIVSLEHSLLSISKWEAKWNKPFLSVEKFEQEELISYIQCMIISPNNTEDIILQMTNENISKISEYIDSPMTATTFTENGKPNNKKKIITSELIYYYMILYNIPFECQKWHINRLLVLIRICSIKSSPEKKMSRREIMAQNHKLNEERKKALKTSG